MKQSLYEYTGTHYEWPIDDSNEYEWYQCLYEAYVIGPNKDLNLTAEQLATLFLYDPEGVRYYFRDRRVYTSNPTHELCEQVFRILTQRDPKYYSLIDGEWTESTSFVSGSYSEAEGFLSREFAPPSLLGIINTAIIGTLLMCGIGELLLLVEGIAAYGFLGALGLYNAGMLGSRWYI